MVTKKLYYNDAYINNFDATVLSCEEVKNGYAIILDKTAFFPEGGGQKSDEGFINDIAVNDVQEVDGNIYHYTSKNIEVGSKVSCSINWEKRFLRMQNHSGEHIVSGIVHSMFGYDNAGFHMEEGSVTVDFNGELTREQLDLVENKANEAVYANYKINCFFPSVNELDGYDYRSKLDLTENVRLVEIENTDLCACCAPHVRSTGEIGVIKILDFMRHRGGVRIVMKSGFDALCDYREKYRNVYEISNLLSAKQENVADYVKRLLDETDSVKRDFYQFRMSVAQRDKEKLKYHSNISYFITDGYDADMMREIANYGAQKSELSIVFSGNDKSGYSYIACSLDYDMKMVAKQINSNLNGRGGGRDTMIQGKVNSLKDTIVNFIETIDFKG